MARYTMLFALLFLSVISVEVLAQESPVQREIRGLVVDGESNEALPRATLELMRVDSAGHSIATGIGALTNDDGSFTLRFPSEERLLLAVSTVGYGRRLLRLGDTMSWFRIPLYVETDFTPEVTIAETRRSRSVEDGCCRVESIRDEIQQQAPFAPGPVEAMRRYSSCTPARVISAIDGASTISLRGLEPTRVGLLLDGAPIFTGLATFYGMSMIPSHALQTVRIAEGSSDARYGNGAISGVVDLQTRPPTEEDEINASVSLMGENADPDGVDVNASYTGMGGGVGIAAFGSYNNHNVRLEDQGGAIDQDYERGSGLVKGNVLLDGVTELELSLLGGREKRRSMIRPESELELHEDLTIDRMDAHARVARLVGEDDELTLRGAVSRLDAEGAFGSQAFDGTQFSGYGSIALDLLAGDHAVRVGAEGRNHQMSDRAGDRLDYELSILSFYAQDVLALGDRWSLLGSVRLDRHSWSGLIASPRASVRFQPEENLTMRLMVGQGFKGEALFDEDYRTIMFGENPGGQSGGLHWRANREADAERSLTANYDVSWNAILTESIGLEANVNAYYTAMSNRFIPDTDSLAAGTLFFVNSDQPAHLAGAEIQLRGTFGESWRASVAAAFIDYRAENLSGEVERVPLSPRMNVDASIAWHDEELGLVAETWGSYIGAQRLPDFSGLPDESPSYVLLNGRVEKELGIVTAFAGLFNAFDVRQSDTTPLVLLSNGHPNGGVVWGPTEGREIFLGARLRLWFGFE